MSARAPLIAAAAAALLLPGCGGGAGDLLAIEVSGGLAGRSQTLVVTEDGHARCNGAERRRIASELLIDAREVERETGELAGKGTDLTRMRPDARQYVLRSKNGTVRFTEGQGLPPELARATLFALELGRAACRPG